jgi:hypothetical protein
MLTCYYGTPWLHHFRAPIGNGKGCAACDGQLSLPMDSGTVSGNTPAP